MAATLKEGFEIVVEAIKDSSGQFAYGVEGTPKHESGTSVFGICKALAKLVGVLALRAFSS